MELSPELNLPSLLKLCDIQLSISFPLKLLPVHKNLALHSASLIGVGIKRDVSISFMIDLQGEKGIEKS